MSIKDGRRDPARLMKKGLRYGPPKKHLFKFKCEACKRINVSSDNKKAASGVMDCRNCGGLALRMRRILDPDPLKIKVPCMFRLDTGEVESYDKL